MARGGMSLGEIDQTITKGLAALKRREEERFRLVNEEPDQRNIRRIQELDRDIHQLLNALADLHTARAHRTPEGSQSVAYG